MPITPFHFGPGLLVKSVIPKKFSFQIFILTNIIIDLEPIYFILTNQYPSHRFFHTYLGATAVAIVCILIGRPVCRWTTNIWNRISKSFTVNNVEISKSALISAAFIGSYGQVLLDSIMHRDVIPFNPFSTSNHLFQFLNYQQLHLMCVLAGVLGMALYFFRKLQKKKTAPGTSKG